MNFNNIPLVNSTNEWDPLEECIVGIADHSMFPSEDKRMIEVVMPAKWVPEFRNNHSFPADIVKNANKELDNFAAILETFGVKVTRPRVVDWSNPETPGYTGSMVRDALLVAGNKIIEAPMAWKCRNHEYLAYEPLFDLYAASPSNEVIRRPPHSPDEDLYAGGSHVNDLFIVNDNRPAFDAADFMKVGNNTIIGQYSHVTNPSGVEYLRKCLDGTGIELHLIEGRDSHAMHIDTTAIPLKEGLMLYMPERTDPEELRKVPALKNWTFVPNPIPAEREYPPFYMSTGNLNMNVLSLDGQHVFIEAADDGMADLLIERGMTPVRVPFQHVHSLGGSFHCSTLDVRRRPKINLLAKSSDETVFLRRVSFAFGK